MTDIVRRLREPPFGTETSERNLMIAAADEITRLTAEVERLGRALNVARYGEADFAWSVHEAQMVELRAENERLRAALEEINVGEGWAALIARAALKKETAAQ